MIVVIITREDERVTAPTLVACSHGTRDPAGRRAVAALVAAVRAARPTLDVHEAFVDVQEPAAAEVVRQVCDSGGSAVVVPLLLSTGYHVGVDIADAVRGQRATAAPALGPDLRVTSVLLQRLREAGLRPDDAVLVAAAGSSDPRATADVAAAVDAVAVEHPGPVSAGFGASASPSVPEAVAAARRDHPGRRVVVAAYLLAPGHFLGRLHEAGADVVSDALLADVPTELVDVVLDRFDAAAVTLER